MWHKADIRDRYGLTDDDYEIIDGQEVLKDGRTMRVPSTMRDSAAANVQRQIRDASLVRDLAAAGVKFHDGCGRPAGHAPGYCFPTDETLLRRRAAVADAYEERARADAEAWRNPRPWAGAALEPAEVPNHLTADALQMLDERERAYREVEERDRNAWRNPRGATTR